MAERYSKFQPLIAGVPGGIGKGRYTPFGLNPPPAPSAPVVLAPVTPITTAPAETPQPAPGPAPSGPQRIYESRKYGEMVLLPYQFAAAGSVLVLPRPPGGSVRAFLSITNDHTTDTMRVNWGADAGAALGQQLAAGGTMWFDAWVPQNNVYIYSPAVAVVTLSYANVAAPVS